MLCVYSFNYLYTVRLRCWYCRNCRVFLSKETVSARCVWPALSSDRIFAPTDQLSLSRYYARIFSAVDEAQMKVDHPSIKWIACLLRQSIRTTCFVITALPTRSNSPTADTPLHRSVTLYVWVGCRSIVRNFWPDWHRSMNVKIWPTQISADYTTRSWVLSRP